MPIPLSFENFPAAPKGDTDQPRLIMSNDSVVGLYNMAHRDAKQRKNTKKVVKRWFTETAKNAGWTKVKWYPEFEKPRGLAALLIYKHQETTNSDQTENNVEK